LLHALSLSNPEFQFLGYSDVRGVLAEEMAKEEEIKQTNLNKSINQVRAITKKWYAKEEDELVSVNVISKKRRFENA
jgi:hypothetical protein